MQNHKAIERILNEFEEWARSRVSVKTLHDYRREISQHLVWLVQNNLVQSDTREELDLTQINAQVLGQYRDYLSAKYRNSTPEFKWSCLQQLYGMAYQKGSISVDPIAGLKPPIGNPAEIVEPVTIEELHSVLNAPDMTSSGGKRDKAILTLMILHGLKVNEINRLTLDSIDRHEERWMLRVVGRENSRRNVYLVKPSMDILEVWPAERQTMRAASDALFLNRHRAGRSLGQGLSKRSVRAIVDSYLGEIGAKRIGVSCDALRHNYSALRLEHAGMSLPEIGQAIVHHNIAPSQSYGAADVREKLQSSAPYRKNNARSNRDRQQILDLDEFLIKNSGWANELYQYLGKMRAGFYDQEYLNAMFLPYEGRPYNLYDAYYFAQIHAALQQGRMLYARVYVGVVPEQDEKNTSRNKEILHQAPEPFSAIPQSGTGVNDGEWKWKSSIRLGQSEVSPWSVPLEIGYTEAQTTITHLMDSRGLVRWPYHSKWVYLFYVIDDSLWSLPKLVSE